MKVIDHLRNAQRPLLSFEIIPPLKGRGIEDIYKAIDPLLAWSPSFINVTYHRVEYAFKEREDGLLERYTVRKRPGTVGICAAIKYKYGIDSVPHLTCGGFSKEETEDALIDLNFLGIENVLAIRGDAIRSEKFFKPHARGHAHATDLIEQVINLNHGRYLHEEMENPGRMDFCVGVAGYPEKHAEAPNLETDLHFLKKKVELGADYIVTQMFFDNTKYFSFVESCRKVGITVPIIPGLKPFSAANQLQVFPQIFHVDLPQDLVSEVLKCTTAEAVTHVGREWAAMQCKGLLAYGVPGLHFYTMGRSVQTAAVLSMVF